MKIKGMLEHCPDQFLPKTKPKPNINLRKRKNSFLRTPKKHRKKTEPSRKGGFRKNSNKRPPQKKLLRAEKEREPSKFLLGSVWFKREFFPFTAQAFSGRLLSRKRKGKRKKRRKRLGSGRGKVGNWRESGQGDVLTFFLWLC